MAKKRYSKKGRHKVNVIPVMRGCLTVVAELCGIAGFLLALYIFLKEYL